MKRLSWLMLDHCNALVNDQFSQYFLYIPHVGLISRMMGNIELCKRKLKSRGKHILFRKSWQFSDTTNIEQCQVKCIALKKCKKNENCTRSRLGEMQRGAGQCQSQWQAAKSQSWEFTHFFFFGPFLLESHNQRLLKPLGLGLSLKGVAWLSFGWAKYPTFYENFIWGLPLNKHIYKETNKPDFFRKGRKWSA